MFQPPDPDELAANDLKDLLLTSMQQNIITLNDQVNDLNRELKALKKRSKTGRQSIESLQDR